MQISYSREVSIIQLHLRIALTIATTKSPAKGCKKTDMRKHSSDVPQVGAFHFDCGGNIKCLSNETTRPETHSLIFGNQIQFI